MNALLERTASIDALLGVRDRASQGRGSTVLIEGEAGIGKTSLLQEFAERAGEGVQVSWGWCEALFTPVRSGPCRT